MKELDKMADVSERLYFRKSSVLNVTPHHQSQLNTTPSTPTVEELYQKSEDIYATIFPSKQPRTSLSLAPSLSTKRKKKRARPLSELVDTEDKYVENLIMVRDKFRDQLFPNFLSQDRSGQIFYKLDELIDLHTDIAMEIKPKRADIGHVFSKHIQRITDLYSGYCINLPHAVTLIEEMCGADPQLRERLQACQATATPPTFPLSSHLVIPFQRFLKYHLLLKEILKYTDEDLYGGGLFFNLNKAVEDMMRAGEAVNELKREAEELDRANERDDAEMEFTRKIESSIKNMRLDGKLTDFGRLRKVGGDIEVYRGGSANSGSAALLADYAFLFDKVIILCFRPKWLQHRYRFREAIKTKDIFLEAPRFRAPDHNSNSFNSNLTTIRCFSKVNPNRILFSLVAKSQGDTEAWFASLVTALDAINPQENQAQGHVIELSTFPERTECSHCGKVLAGHFFQGYRCLRCQAVLHKSCLDAFNCLEVGTQLSSCTLQRQTVGRTDSGLVLPVIETSDGASSAGDRGSTLSLAGSDFGANNKDGGGGDRRSAVINDYDTSLRKELTELPLQRQSWFAGDLPTKVGQSRLEGLPLGTFLVRQRANNSLALMVKTADGVKQMKIEEAREITGHKSKVSGGREDQQSPIYYLSEARNFHSVQELVVYYRSHDLTENFNYDFLKGLKLRTPFKDV